MGNNGNNAQQIRCPSCGCELVVTPVSNIRENTEELYALLTGTLNKFKCTECSMEFLFDSPIIYRDDDKKFVIYHHASAATGDLDEALDCMDKIYKTMFAGLSENDRPNCRLTLRRKDLIEKIKINQQDYDDRLIEYIKYQLFTQSKDLNAETMDLLFDFASSNSENLVFLAFDQASGSPVYSMNFPVAEYSNLKNNFLGTEELTNKFNTLFRKYYVHVSNLLE